MKLCMKLYEFTVISSAFTFSLNSFPITITIYKFASMESDSKYLHKNKVKCHTCLFAFSKPKFRVCPPFNWVCVLSHYTDTSPHSSDALQHYANALPDYANTSPHYASTLPHYANTLTHYANTLPHYVNTLPRYVNTLPHYANNNPARNQSEILMHLLSSA